MSDNSYRKEIVTAASANQVYQALTADIGKWWTLPDKTIVAQGDEVTFRFAPNPTYWTMRVLELVPGQQVLLRCIAANHVHEGLPDSIAQEWLNTELDWQIAPLEEGCRIQFEHRGLTPALHCFEVCTQGWDYFVGQSLIQYLEAGQGSPGPIE